MTKTKTQTKEKGLAFWEINGAQDSECKAGKFIEKHARPLMSRNVKSEDHNYLITSTNFEKLSEQLGENEVLLVIFRTGYCGLNVHVATIRSAGDFAQLKKNLVHILVER